MTKSLAKRKLAVLVAKDVLSRIKAEAIIPKRGVYLRSRKLAVLILKSKPGIELQKLLRMRKAPPCTACAIGSIFLSIVRLRNEFTTRFAAARNWEHHQPGMTIGSYDMRQRLHEAFTPDELERIENYFETDHPHRMTLPAIMNNIIKNKGTFNP